MIEAKIQWIKLKKKEFQIKLKDEEISEEQLF